MLGIFSTNFDKVSKLSFLSFANQPSQSCSENNFFIKTSKYMFCNPNSFRDNFIVQYIYTEWKSVHCFKAYFQFWSSTCTKVYYYSKLKTLTFVIHAVHYSHEFL